MCLSRSAHVMAPNHPIFHSPFPVDLEYESVPTPDHYRKWFDSTDLPEELPVWQVETTDYTLDDSLKPGTVSVGWGFDDSPDAEVIAGGINSKAPHAVALGRHGSLFLWGFACEPGRMTPSGRSAFLNAICYIRAFDHAPRLVDDVAYDRRWALQRAKRPEEFAQLEADLEYLRGDGSRHAVDEDCKALGISNRNLALLDHCVAALHRGEDVARCQRLLERYTALGHDTAAEWSAWLEESRERLFFSDIGGFRWFEARGAGSDRGAGDAQRGLDPVTVSASVAPAEVGPGEVVTLEVRFRHAPGWHTYGTAPDDSPYPTTQLHAGLPDGWNPVGRWTRPDTVPMEDLPAVGMVEGLAVYRLRVRIPDDAPPGPAVLGVRANYMACDAEVCLPPEDADLRVTVQVGKS